MILSHAGPLPHAKPHPPVGIMPGIAPGVVLGLRDVPHPFLIAVSDGKIHEHMLRGKRGVRRPAVFLSLAAVDGIVIEIGKIAAPRRLLKPVYNFIRALEAAAFFQL